MTFTRQSQLVCEVLGTRILSGKVLREALRGAGLRKTGPGFYLMMHELEEAGVVECIRGVETIDGERFTTRSYRVHPNALALAQENSLDNPSPAAQGSTTLGTHDYSDTTL